jgi:spermidine/putrescine transport system ATP-binding protein
MAQPDFAVELVDVTKQFPDPAGGLFTAVRDVTMRIRDGEFFSMLGPSGCGKTTSLRMIAGFELPTSGDVFIHGRAMGRTPPYKRPVNTVFQSYALFPHLTIGENVAFGLQMDGVAKSEIAPRVKEALAMVRLPGLEARKPRQLSGGQQQRVALARALVKRPEVLLLDEPLGALDQKLRKEMQLELKKLQREVGITFVFVTHDQEEALTMSDRIAVMSQGDVLQVGGPEEIYEQPNCRFVADFIGETNFLQGSVVERSDEMAAVRLEAGAVVHARAAEPCTTGDAVSITVRPEKIQLFATQEEAAQCAQNCFGGVVADVVYIGTDTHYDIDLGGGQHVRVRRQNRAAGSPLAAREGEAVTIGFAPDAARVLLK